MATVVESLSGVKLTIPYQEESYTLKNHINTDSTITVNYTLNGVSASLSFTQGVSYTYLDSHAKGQYDGDKTFNFGMFQDGDVLVLNDIEYEGAYAIYGFKEDKSKVELIDFIYPVGSIYISVNNVNPGTFIGGTWVKWGSGKVPVGVDTSQTEFNASEKTGGSKTHKLTVNELPSHYHTIDGPSREVNYSTGGATVGTYDTESSGTEWTSSVGGNQAHNNLQPYITCYMWKRTA